MNIVAEKDVDNRVLYSDSTIDTLDFSEWKLLSILQRIESKDIPRIVDTLNELKYCRVVDISPKDITATLSTGEIIPINYLGYGEKILLISECAAIYKIPIYLYRVYKSLTDKSLVFYLNRYKSCNEINLIVQDVFDEALIDMCSRGGAKNA